MTFDYSKLIGRIREKGLTQGKVAQRIGVSDNTFTSRIKSRTYFCSAEIEEICKLLDIGSSEIGAYFFTPSVEVSKQNLAG